MSDDDDDDGWLGDEEPEESAPVDNDLRARASDPATSHLAMAAYPTAKMQKAEDVVVTLHQLHGPLASFQLSPLFDDAFPWGHDESLHRQARNQARNKGRIVETAERRLNPATKRWQTVWAYEPNPVPPDTQVCPECGGVLGRTKGAPGVP